MLQHVVLFSFPSPLSKDEIAEMRSLVRAWASEVDDLNTIRLGAPLSPEAAGGYGYLLYLELDDLDALERYLAHPAHARFGAWIAERKAHPLVVSYYLDDSTVFKP
jgi:hypothetical protein